MDQFSPSPEKKVNWSNSEVERNITVLHYSATSRATPIRICCDPVASMIV